MKLEPIRIRFVPRNQQQGQSNPRDAFWQSFRNRDNDAIFEGRNISALEGDLRREFGPQLGEQLIRELSKLLRHAEDVLGRNELGDLREFARGGSASRNKENAFDQAQVIEAYTRYLERRQQVFRDNPAVRRLQDRVTAACSTTFSVRIAGYSSLDVDLSLSSIESIAQAFDNNFESFRIFLEAFVPEAFERVFPPTSGTELETYVTIPPEYERAFATNSEQVTSSPPNSTSPVRPEIATPPAASSRERAEWLWRLANGSLLVPFAIALFVMYYGMLMMRDIRKTQSEALEPILEHQLKLLEEDRKRMFKESKPLPASPPVAGAPAL